MGLLIELGQEQGHLKAGFRGFEASGKTYTAMLLAMGTRKYFDLTGPIAMFDTEGGSQYIKGWIEKQTGTPLLGTRSQSFTDLMAVANECEDAKISVFVVDSITHVWRELCDAYLDQVNQRRAEKRLPPRTKLEFQDWGPIKMMWKRWTDFYLNSRLHIIVCGRAGYIYDMEENEETGKKDLIKTGIKMKTETEFGFEPSLLIEMERMQVSDGKGGFDLQHMATVIKDRFNVIDGHAQVNPTFAFFEPFVACLKVGGHAPVDTALKTDMHVDEQGQNDYDRLKKRRLIAWERLENGLGMIFPGGTGKDKQARFAILSQLFGTTSETQVQQSVPERLELAATVVDLLGKNILDGDVPNFAGDLVALKKKVGEIEQDVREMEAGQPLETPEPKKSRRPATQASDPAPSEAATDLTPDEALCGDQAAWDAYCREQANGDETGSRWSAAKKTQKLGRDERVSLLPITKRLAFLKAYRAQVG